MHRNEATARAQYILGGYEIVDMIGTGGMGIVYRARDLSLNRIVALKVLQDDLRAQPHIVARFQREAEAAATLNHPNIVHVYAVGANGGVPFIAMEYVDGQTLSEVLKHEERIEWVRALKIGRQIACALQCAHEAQVIHRDIKPSNVLLDADDHAYVTDFGIAKVLWAATQLTVDGTRLGTPQYMCPERYQNKPVSFASDLYSLGVLLFQAMSSCLPFDGENAADFARQVLRQPAPRLKEFAPDVPESVDRLVAHLLERDPAARPASALAVVELIDRALNGMALDDAREAHVQAVTRVRVREEYATPQRTPSLHQEKKTERPRLEWGRGTCALVISGFAFAAAAAGFILARPESIIAFDAGPTPIMSQRPDPLVRASEEMPGVFLSRLTADGYLVRELGGGDVTAVLLSNKSGESTVAVFSEPDEGKWLLPPARPVFGSVRLVAVAQHLGLHAVMLETPEGTRLANGSGYRPGKMETPVQVPATLEVRQDKAGRLQVFDSQGRQRTFLEHGVGAQIVRCGAWHVAPLATEPGLVWVK